MNNSLNGFLIYTEKFGWQVRYEFGKSQVKHLLIHKDSIKWVKEFGLEGEEVDFVVRGTSVPNTLNGVVSSALIIQKKNPD